MQPLLYDKYVGDFPVQGVLGIVVTLGHSVLSHLNQVLITCSMLCKLSSMKK